MSIILIFVTQICLRCPTRKVGIQCSVFPSHRFSKGLIVMITKRFWCSLLSAQSQQHSSQLSSLTDIMNWLEFTLKMKPPFPLLFFFFLNEWLRGKKNEWLRKNYLEIVEILSDLWNDLSFHYRMMCESNLNTEGRKGKQRNTTCQFIDLIT